MTRKQTRIRRKNSKIPEKKERGVTAEGGMKEGRGGCRRRDGRKEGRELYSSQNGNIPEY